MQPSALRALEFDRIVEAVTDFALTPMGAERLSRLAPSTDPQQVAQWQAATTETVRFVTAHGAVPAARVERAAADPRRARRRRARARIAAAARAGDLSRLDRRVARRHPPRARILPAARRRHRRRRVVQGRDRRRCARRSTRRARSSIMRARSCGLIRDRLRKQKTRLRSTLESYLRGKETAKYLQDQVVSERNGRYVLLVKAEHRSGIPGIVHGTSTSGASLFLEPLSTVEINNDIVALEEQEAEEVRRILLALTDAFRRRARRPAADDRRGDRARRPAGPRALLRVDRRHRAGALDRRRLRAAGRAPSAAQEPGAGDDQGDSAGDDPARDRTEHRRQDRRAEDRRAARDDDAGRAAHSRRSTDRACRCSDRCSPTSATSSRSKRA